jgi:uncharacterized membrane protein YhaH (DUF805 family)
MDISHVLLSPKGRIGSRDFLRGLILLTGASLVVQVLTSSVSIGASVLQYPLLWGYLCVLGKRLHDAGQTAWLSLIFLLGFVVLSSILDTVLIPLLSPQMVPLIQQIQEVAKTEGLSGAFNAQQEHMLELSRGLALTTLASFLISSTALAFIGARLPSDPKSNSHGPATGSSNAS